MILDKATHMSHNMKKDIEANIQKGAAVGAKGEKTKQLICAKAYKLFAEKGYKDVTMKDISESAGISRGGLYRHYQSTEEIFCQITRDLLDRQGNEFAEKIKRKCPAVDILEDVLARYEKEMIDSGNSLSIAIYEFFSNPQRAGSRNSISLYYETSKSMWMELIEYGMAAGEFKKVDPGAVFDLIVFSYQGVRMYSRLMPIQEDIPRNITGQIRRLLLRKSGEEE